jgi:hypothetical protein
MIRARSLILASVAVASILVSRPAFAGPPLLCFPFEIGNARTLPMGTAGWHSIDPAYDAARLVDETLALLGPNTPVLVRMETLRRATVYASTDPKVANALLNALQEVETYRQAKWIFSAPIPAIDRIDGYQLVLKAHALQGDPAMQLAAAIIAAGSSATKAESRGHLEQAKAHADSDRTLALNISKHFQ